MTFVDNRLCESYEELRSQAMGRYSSIAPPRGLALFLSQGMPAWISAWSYCAPAARTAAPDASDVKDGILLDGFRVQVAMVLASMALQVQKEAPSC